MINVWKRMAIALGILSGVMLILALAIPVVGKPSARAFHTVNSAHLRQVVHMLRERYESGGKFPASVLALPEYVVDRENLGFMVSEKDDALRADWILAVNEWPQSDASDTVVAVSPGFSESRSGKRFRHVAYWDGYVEALDEAEFWAKMQAQEDEPILASVQ